MENSWFVLTTINREGILQLDEKFQDYLKYMYPYCSAFRVVTSQNWDQEDLIYIWGFGSKTAEILYGKK